jgi:hypothetical protein
MESYIDSARGVTTLAEAFRRRPSPLSHLMGAFVLADRANDSGDPADAEKAMQEANFAKMLLPDNPAAFNVSAYAHLTAAAAYANRHDAERARSARDQGTRDNRELERFLDRIPALAFYHAWHLQALDQDDAAYEVLRRVGERPGSGQSVGLLAILLYRRGQFGEALQVLERAQKRGLADPFLDYWRAIVLAEFPDRRDEAVRLAKEAAQRSKGFAHFFSPTMLLLLGQKVEAAAAFDAQREFAEQMTWSTPLARGYIIGVVDYSREKVSADELVRAAQSSRWCLDRTHHIIGLSYLADGHRQRAEQHFRESIAAHNLYSLTTDWSRNFLARLKKDRAWPPWIPIKD